MPDVLTPKQRSYCMSRIRSSNTSIEVSLRKLLWRAGYRYRKNYSKLPGTPDIAITKQQIAIFCDGEFFHGKNWETGEREHVGRGKRGDFWQKKIEHNMAHDNEVDRQLNELGWTVIRFWGNEIKKHPDFCLKAVEECIMEKKVNAYDVLSFDDGNEPLLSQKNVAL